MRALLAGVVLALLAGCSIQPTPWVLGERAAPPIGDVLCKQERPGECD